MAPQNRARVVPVFSGSPSALIRKSLSGPARTRVPTADLEAFDCRPPRDSVPVRSCPPRTAARLEGQALWAKRGTAWQTVSVWGHPLGDAARISHSGPKVGGRSGAACEDCLTEPIGGQLGCDLLGSGGRGPVERGEVKGAVFRPTRQEAEEVADVADRLDAVQAGAGEKRDEGGVGEGAVFAAQEEPIAPAEDLPP
jgi:hypothetical protein